MWLKQLFCMIESRVTPPVRRVVYLLQLLRLGGIFVAILKTRSATLANPPDTLQQVLKRKTKQGADISDVELSSQVQREHHELPFSRHVSVILLAGSPSATRPR